VGKRLYVGGLPYSVTDNQLSDVFTPFGAVVSQLEGRPLTVNEARPKAPRAPRGDFGGGGGGFGGRGGRGGAGGGGGGRDRGRGGRSPY